VHHQIVQSIPLDDAHIECLIQGLRLVTPCTRRIDRLIDLLEQIRGGGRQAAYPRTRNRAARSLDFEPGSAMPDTTNSPGRP
jgi:hypothetical protein